MRYLILLLILAACSDPAQEPVFGPLDVWVGDVDYLTAEAAIDLLSGVTDTAGCWNLVDQPWDGSSPPAGVAATVVDDAWMVQVNADHPLPSGTYRQGFAQSSTRGGGWVVLSSSSEFYYKVMLHELIHIVLGPDWVHDEAGSMFAADIRGGEDTLDPRTVTALQQYCRGD